MNQYKNEERISRECFDKLKKGIDSDEGIFSLQTIIDECKNENCVWKEPEWGFPKGRRNSKERDYETALREFEEETGYNKNTLNNFQNIFSFEEIFMGSNYKCYKHKYYLAYMDYNNSLNPESDFQKSEVSKVEWKTFEECLLCIRTYNLEKKRFITNIEECLKNYRFDFA
jgi:ADP-ribose pyrophosphatase YjhB (NUDIX family)